MKLFDKKRILVIAVSIFLGLLLAAYLIYDQLGKFGPTGFIALGITLIISVSVSYLMIKIGNK